MYRYELHCHEKLVSRCGVWSPREMAEIYAELGYSGIVVTDHFFNGNCGVDRNLPWREKVALFCEGYEQTKAEGAKLGLDVFFGFEYSVKSFYEVDFSKVDKDLPLWKNTLAGCDFLIYGLDKKWLLDKDESILSMPVNGFLKMVKEEGGTVVQAHPFRLEKAYMDHISLFPEYTDGVEILNANPNTQGVPNRMAKAYAKEYGFFQTAGSDMHRNDKYLAVTKLPERVNAMEELIRALKEGRAKFSLVKNKLYQ